MYSHKIIQIPAPNDTLSGDIVKALGISPLVAQILINRGVKTPEAASRFLGPDTRDLIDPFRFADMRKAVALVQEARRKKERIMVFGDYDADGITALVVIKTTLERLGCDAVTYIPHRIKEGYSLSGNILSLVKENKAGLLITADCGTSSNRHIQELRRNGIEVIVTDHHEPHGEGALSASASINPKLSDSGYPFRDLAGVGVAYKFCQAVSAKPLFEDLDMVTLGTIADVVPLSGENRVFVKQGLPVLSESKRPGLVALLESSGIIGKEITAGLVSFVLAPRINASGRMGAAETSLRLLLSEKQEEAQLLAQEIEAHNRKRQKVEGAILEEAQHLIDREINFKDHRVIVVAKEGWHQGVLGVVASKLADKFYRPTILISLTEGLCKGSGRSIKNFHLFSALGDCRELLDNFGGHAHAVGLVIDSVNIADFRDKINRLAQDRLRLEDLLPSLEIDMAVSLHDFDGKVIDELEMLEPYGTGNRQPLFLTRDLRLKGQAQVLGRETLKFWVTDGVTTHQAIGFGMSSLCRDLENSNCFDLVFYPRRDRWQGDDAVILEVEDIFFK
jgi:single-stranded-DNA-specific exonuclease